MKRANNEGSIFQRGSDGLWCAAWTDPETGKQRRRYAKSKSAALAILDDVRGRLRAGRPGVDANDTFRTVAARWSEVSLEVDDVKQSTRETYRAALKLWVLPHLGAIRLCDLVRSDVERMLLALRRAGKSGQTQRTALTVTRKILAVAVDDGLLATNPADKVRRPAATPVRPRFVPERSIVRTLLAACPDDVRPLVALVAYTGLRPGEALGLTWDEVDLEAGRMTVAGTLRWSRTTRETEKTAPKTRTSVRTLPLPAPVVTELRAWRRRQREIRLASPVWLDATPWVFTTSHGEPIPPANAAKALQAVRAEAGLPGVTFRSLRHATATTLLEEGVPMRVVAELLGHSSTRVTADTYSHVTTRLVDEATEALGRAYGG